jgi:hypothetical protein
MAPDPGRRQRRWQLAGSLAVALALVLGTAIAVGRLVDPASVARTEQGLSGRDGGGDLRGGDSGRGGRGPR